MSFSNCGLQQSPIQDISVTVAKAKLNFEVLQINDIPYYQNHIVGCIVQCHPPQLSNRYGKRRKLVVKEAAIDGTLGEKELFFFLYQKFVDITRDLRVGDYITVSGFEVSENTCYDHKNPRNMYPYVIELLDNCNLSNGKEPTAHITKMPVFRFDNLKMNGKSYNGICIIGRIIELIKIQKDFMDRIVLKVVLKEVRNDNSLGDLNLDCLIYDELVNKYKDLNIGDTISISSFKVEARPSTSASMECLTSYAYHIELHKCNNVVPVLKVIKAATEKQKRPESMAESIPKRNTSYQYTLLCDLKLDVRNRYNIKQRFNFYGVVVKAFIRNANFKECLEVEVRDPTLDSFVVFVQQHSSAENFPEVRPYDIIRFHRVVLETNRNSLQGQCFSPNNVLVFSGIDLDAEPIHTSRTFTLTPEDRRLVERLRSWSKPFNGLQPVTKRKICKTPLNLDLTNCSAQTLGYENESLKSTMATKNNVINKVIVVNEKSPIPENIQQQNLEIVRQDVNESENTCLNDNENFCVNDNIMLPLLHAGNDISNKETDPSADDQNLNAISSETTGEPYDPKVIYSDMIFPLKLVSVPIGMENAPVIEIRDLKNVPFSSRSRVQARIVAMKPEPIHANESIYLLCNNCQYFVMKCEAKNFTFIKTDEKHSFLCPNCLEIEQRCIPLEYCFFIGILLDDGTGTVDTYLYKSQATFFFRDVSAEQCCSQNILYFKFVVEKLQHISSFPDCFKNPPVLDVCLYKYKSSIGQQYRIVDTKLL